MEERGGDVGYSMEGAMGARPVRMDGQGEGKQGKGTQKNTGRWVGFALTRQVLS